MKSISEFATLAAFAGILVFGISTASAAPPFPLPQGPPVWCYGQVDDECRLFLGTEETCMNVDPCLTFLSASPAQGPITPDLGGLFFCLGEVNDQCMLLLGTEQDCMNVSPCLSRNGQLPRAPRETRVR